MSSGRERAVLVWEARHALATARMEQIERALSELASIEEPPSRKRRERAMGLATEREQVMVALARLGPAPHAKMG
jgi:hypothetical protein